jgi:hypothetical protein
VKKELFPGKESMELFPKQCAPPKKEAWGFDLGSHTYSYREALKGQGPS